VTAVTMGPKISEEVLWEALAIGGSGHPPVRPSVCRKRYPGHFLCAWDGYSENRGI
jgi:hypothetical protein